MTIALKKSCLRDEISKDNKESEFEKEHRCPVCRRLLMRGKIVIIETRCPKCKKITILKG